MAIQLDLLRERFKRVFAIDPHRRPFKQAAFSYATAEFLPYPDETFDLVFSSNSLEHIKDLPLALGEAVRVVRKGGYMALGNFTGMKWLLDKENCLVINPGEGFCRD